MNKLRNAGVAVQSNHGRPVRIVNVSSKMHELSPGIDIGDPHFAKGRAYSSLAAYNRSKLAQVLLTIPLGNCGLGVRSNAGLAILALAGLQAHYAMSLKGGAILQSLLEIWQVVFTAELRRRLPAKGGIVTAAVHPGEVMTDVVRTLPGLMQTAYRFFMRPFCLSPAEGPVPCQADAMLPLLGCRSNRARCHTRKSIASGSEAAWRVCIVETRLLTW